MQVRTSETEYLAPRMRLQGFGERAGLCQERWGAVVDGRPAVTKHCTHEFRSSFPRVDMTIFDGRVIYQR